MRFVYYEGETNRILRSIYVYAAGETARGAVVSGLSWKIDRPVKNHVN